MIMTPYKRKLTLSEIEMCEIIINDPFIKISEMCRKYNTDDGSVRKCLTTYFGIVESIKFFANREKMRFDITDSKIEEAKKLLRKGVHGIRIMKSCNLTPKDLRIANYNNGTPISQVRINLMSVAWEQGKSIEDMCKQFELGAQAFSSIRKDYPDLFLEV